MASKIQFEENWVIFLSVINLYVDETFQLQVTCPTTNVITFFIVEILLNIEIIVLYADCYHWSEGTFYDGKVVI